MPLFLLSGLLALRSAQFSFSPPAWFAHFASRLPLVLAAVACLFLAGCADDSGNRFLVDAKINDQPVHLALDTGSNRPALFQPTPARLGIKIVQAAPTVQLPAASTPAGVTEACTLAFWNGTTATRFGVITMPPYLDNTFDGLLGWPNLQQNILQFDALNHTCTVLNQVPAETSTWVKFNLLYNSGLLVLSAPEPGGGSMVIFVDTGSDQGVALSPDGWAKWRDDHPHPPDTINAYFTPSAGLVIAEESWAPTLTLGPLVLTNVPIQSVGYSPTTFFPPGKPDATFGMDALKRVDFIVDGPGRVAYLRPRHDAPPEFGQNRLGAVFIPPDPSKDEPLIAHVIEGSPAYRAGIRNGDVLLRINRFGISHWRTVPRDMSVFGFWNAPVGSIFDLTLQRWGREFTTTVILRELIGPDAELPDDSTN